MLRGAFHDHTLKVGLIIVVIPWDTGWLSLLAA